MASIRDSVYPAISEYMCRNKCETLIRHLHFVDNTLPNTRNKVWKLLPWLNTFRDNCLYVKPQEQHSVDEMCIKYRGNTSVYACKGILYD